MFQKKLKVAAWLLNTAVLSVTAVVGFLAFQLVTDKDSLTGEIEPWCATVEQPFYDIVYQEEVIHNVTGRALFQNNCTQCHSLSTEVIVGPGLAGVMERHSKEWVYAFVLSSSEMIEKKDSAAVAVFNTFAQQQMPSFALARPELDSLFDYINAQPRAIPAVAVDYHE
ncbi:cytochrome c [Rufibacter sp. LB8]|uniref:c-type cytochrome n=1 Tax=Rufibacter sp. LB8 TaxID=2777781 RepID=UPI00178C2D67|nr:cytochrome c [Rufibacter sp. LB8]